MKVLSFTWTIYDHRLDMFCKNCTGGGLVIKNICEYIGRHIESYLFIGKFKMPEMELGNIRIVGTDSVELEGAGLNQADNHLIAMAKSFETALAHIKPDIVNFHGKGDLMRHCIDICIKQKIPYAVTEHLYIGRQHTGMDRYDRAIKWENDLYTIPGIKIIAVSSGIKRRILNDFPNFPPENISVILNGTDFCAEHVQSDFKQIYQLNGKKMLLCVGTILERKNQRQIVRAFQLLPEHIKQNLKIIFCGNDRLNGLLQQDITDAGLQEQLIFVGAVSSDVMKQYYSAADGLIMPSLAEGLSIATLESIAYGLPVIMFSDSECADDLNDIKAVCLAHGRGDQNLADAVEYWYMNEWDNHYIMQYAERFTLDKMAENYLVYYKQRLIEACRDLQ